MLARNGPGHALLFTSDGSVLRVARDGDHRRFHPATESGAAIGLDAAAGHFATLYRDSIAVRLTLHDTRGAGAPRWGDSVAQLPAEAR